MTKLFLLSAGLGFVAAVCVSACGLNGPTGRCGSSVSSGTFAIGSPINFADTPPNVSGGTLRVDLGSGRVTLTYPDGDRSVDFASSVGGNGGQGGAN